MIMEEVKPDSGSFSLGDTVKLVYVDQSHKTNLIQKKQFGKTLVMNKT